MLRMVFECLVCIFAAYGLIAFLYEALFTGRHVKCTGSMIKTVLIVKNQAEIIEGVLRNILRRDSIRKLMPGGRLIVLDMGSKDDTMEILKRLERDYECIQVLKGSEGNSIFKCFEDM